MKNKSLKVYKKSMTKTEDKKFYWIMKDFKFVSTLIPRSNK